MARVLVIGDSMSLAHVARAMVVARRLEGEGHDVRFATGSAHLDLVRREGFDPQEVECVDPATAIAAIRRGSHIFDRPTVERYVESDLRLLDELAPDLVVGDMRLSLNVSCELAGVEHWSILSGYTTHYYTAPQRPPETLPIVRRLGPRLSGWLFPLLKRMTLREYGRNFAKCRRRHGLKPIRDVFDVIASPHRNLVADLPEYAPLEKAPPSFQYIGPLIWEPRIDPPEWLDELDPERTTVYVTMGSTGDTDEFGVILETLIEADYQVLATTGSQSVHVPPGVFACRYAPGSALLARSQAMVCHGGSLTVYQAIHEGVPVVGLPTFHDQEINMDRVEALGWGRRVGPLSWTHEELLSALQAVLEDDVQHAVSRGRSRLRRFVADSEGIPLLESPTR